MARIRPFGARFRKPRIRNPAPVRKLGKYVKVGSVFLANPGGTLHMRLGKTHADYKSPVKNALPGTTDRIASRLNGKKLEQKALGLLRNDSNKRRIMGLTEGALNRNDIAVELEDIARGFSRRPQACGMIARSQDYRSSFKAGRTALLESATLMPFDHTRPSSYTFAAYTQP